MLHIKERSLICELETILGDNMARRIGFNDFLDSRRSGADCCFGDIVPLCKSQEAGQDWNLGYQAVCQLLHAYACGCWIL